MEISDIKQIAFLILNPSLFGERLAFRAVSIATRVIGNFNVAAAFTNILMTT